MSTPNLTGKTCLITGATSGIGLEAAVAIARTGATTVITARDPQKGERVLAEIKQRSGSDKVSLLLVNFESQKSIRQLAADFQARHSSLHILVNNAGLVCARREVTEDGFEKTFGVNHLGYFLLTNLLLDTIVASAPARIVNVASDAHARSTIDFDDLQEEKGWSVMKAYGQSKLANVLFTYELARRLEGKNVTVNCLHPGVVATGIWSRAPAYAKPLLAIAKLFFVTPEKGAETIVHLATSPEVDGVTGQYFRDRKARRSNRESHDVAVAKRLWDVSAGFCGLMQRAA